MPNTQRMNLNYLLNKEYYETLAHSSFGKCNSALRDSQFQSGRVIAPFSEHGFCLQTAYPGLLVGIGNPHEAKVGVTGKDEDGAEIKLGFTLDYVTGLPVIPGSTVKGVLHSAFERQADFVAGLLNIGNEQIGDLKASVFTKGADKVVFFDAIPVKAGKDNRLLGLDNITPHGEPLKNPIPLTMLKVIPGVAFLFRFGFERRQGADNKADELLGAFREIILTLGIGAKTNVGYGAMEPSSLAPPYYCLEATRQSYCQNIDCSNPVEVKGNGTKLKYCKECFQKYNERKRKEGRV